MSGVTDPDLGFPEPAIECARSRLAKAGQTELMRVQLEIAAYTELLIACDRNAFLAFHRRALADDLDSGGVACILGILGDLPANSLVAVSYDQERYEALLDECESRA